jgi:A/G-specific adenine glycosylase
MESLLPEDAGRARLANAGTMELGQTVCTSRAPSCDICPVAELCAWRAAGYPAYTGPASPKQKPYAGSDREVRGRILRELRASELPVPATRVHELWPDAVQRERALAGLLVDGLVVAEGDAYALPSSGQERASADHGTLFVCRSCPRCRRSPPTWGRACAGA